MSALPVITAMGGINAAGRSSMHHGFHRLVFDALDQGRRRSTLDALGALSGHGDEQRLLDGTLIRALPESVRLTMAVNGHSDAPVTVEMRNMDLPEPLPAGWRVEPISRQRSRVTLPAGADLRAPSAIERRVSAAGQLPDGFDPAALYPSRNHPRALQMAIYGVSDAFGMLGIPWDSLRGRLAPDQVAVFASNAMAQLDDNGLGGMMRAPALGARTTSKQCPLGLGEMTADFINAYVLRSPGGTGGMLGACATFLYNLERAVHAIRAGRARLVVVGTSEAPLVAEVLEGYRAMGALAEDEALAALDGVSQPDLRRACRPFGDNCGFTMAESAQFCVLMDDALALELGADILGAVPDVFVHADGAKKSISSPGIGNYLTLGRGANLVRQLLGEDALRQRSFVHAHGTGTPQNRVTESHVLNQVAKAFAIEQWPVAAIKAFVGHSLGSAGGDQLAATLGTFAEGLLPGIATVDAFADDLHASHLSLSREHRELRPAAGLLNSKGFGGNNATAVTLSPESTLELLRRRHGDATLTRWQHAVESTREAARDYDQRALRGETRPEYHFNEGVIDGSDVAITDRDIRLPGWDQPLVFRDDPGFDDYRG
ncbi:beta-ketoacyl synthase [Alcanivorax sp. N3-2A]|nr:beta-ketoacyl synthase [Alcanivorax sp. N3-2A]|tara:strand:- start:1774 stop:3579 length:1806 start_codon:yes stop_codon:yes gene_type:complete